MDYWGFVGSYVIEQSHPPEVDCDDPAGKNIEISSVSPNMPTVYQLFPVLPQRRLRICPLSVFWKKKLRKPPLPCHFFVLSR